MKLNKKHLLNMYFISFGMLILSSIIAMLTAVSTLALVTMWILLLVPGLYYFYRNKGYEMIDAAKVSALYGFTAIPAFFIILMIPFGFFEFFAFGDTLDPALLALVDWTKVLMELLRSGAINTLLTMAAYLLVKHVKV